MIWTKSMEIGFWSTWGTPIIRWLPSGKHTKNDGKSLCSIGKSTISLAIFNSFLYVYQRVILKPLSLSLLWSQACGYIIDQGLSITRFNQGLTLPQPKLRIFFRQKRPFSSLRTSPKFVVPTLTTAPFGVDRLLKEQPWELVALWLWCQSVLKHLETLETNSRDQ